MKHVQALSGLATIALSALGAHAGIAPGPLTINIGGGWEVIIADSEHLGITPLNPQTALQDGAVRITKHATFHETDPFTGAPAGLTLTFHQIAPDAQTVPTIIIDQEFINNFTGMHWTSFDQILGLSGAATFDPVSLGMFVGPQFAGNTLSGDLRTFTSSGGLGVAHGASWNPGDNDAPPLIINVDLSQNGPITFVLKEIPRVPAPGGAAVLMGTGVALMARRRRA